VELVYLGEVRQVRAEREVVLSLGAFHTPKVLMPSGIGDEAELKPFGIPLLQHLPGVGRNLQDHVAFNCVWEYQTPLPPRNNASEATFFANTTALGSGRPDIFVCQAEVPITTEENARRFEVPPACWSFHGGIAQPHSKGRIHLTSADPTEPLRIVANTLADEEDVKTAIACVELCRAVGNAAALRPFVRREVMPGPLKGAELEHYIRDAAAPFWHSTCTAKLGRDDLSVVDNRLRVYGVEGLRIADGSILPRLPTGNTMASCVIIGERAAEMLKEEHGI
jgi:choline dehydrogenase